MFIKVEKEKESDSVGGERMFIKVEKEKESTCELSEELEVL